MSLIKNKHYFTISEFAKLFKIHKKTLYHYDEIGLFKPEYINENGYRYYSHEQIYDFHILLALKDMKLSLEDTKKYVNGRTPENMMELLDTKIKDLDKEIKELINLRDSIDKRLSLISHYVDVPIDEIEVKYVEEQYLRLEPIEVTQGNDTNYMTWHNLFSEDNKHHLNESLYGHMVLYENLIKTNFTPNFISIEATDEKDIKNVFVKPYGKYLIGRKNGKCLHSASLYSRLMEYIRENNIEIIGNAYEFFIIDGSFASNFNDRVLEIHIHIK